MGDNDDGMLKSSTACCASLISPWLLIEAKRIEWLSSMIGVPFKSMSTSTFEEVCIRNCGVE